MTVWEANLEALRRSQPALAAALVDAPSYAAQVERAPDGGLTVRTGGTAGAYVASRRAPVREAARLTENLKLNPMQPCVVRGCGLGACIADVLARFPSSTVVVLEPSLGLLRTMLEVAPISAGIRGGKVAFATPVPGQSARDVYAACADEISLFGYGEVVHAYTAGDERYVDLLRELAVWMRMRALELRSDAMGGRQTLHNLMENVPFHLAAPGLKAFEGVLKGVPAVICGAGPSLQRNIDVLAANADRVFVLAVSSALRRVMARGIPVAATNVVDYSHLSQRYFVGLPGEAPPLFVHPRSNPSVLEAYEGPVVTCDDAVYRRFWSGQAADHGDFPGRGTNVSHYAYFAARALGCDPIILVGMDLAYSHHTTHVPGSPIHDEWAASAHRFCSLELQELMFLTAGMEQKPVATDALGNPLHTDELLEAAAIGFEEMFARESGGTVINATEGGRALKGAVNMTLADALAKYAPGKVDLGPYWRALGDGRGEAAGDVSAGLKALRSVRTHATGAPAAVRDALRVLKKSQEKLEAGKVPPNGEISDPALDRLNDLLEHKMVLFEAVGVLASGTRLARQKLESRLSDTTLSELDRLKLLAEREIIYVEAIGDALRDFDAMLESSIRRTEAFIAGGRAAVRALGAAGGVKTGGTGNAGNSGGKA
jgi:hypothetical protein